MSHLKAISCTKVVSLRQKDYIIKGAYVGTAPSYDTETTINIHVHKAQYANLYNFIKLYPQSEWHY